MNLHHCTAYAENAAPHDALASLRLLRIQAIRNHGKAVSNAFTTGHDVTSPCMDTYRDTLRRTLDHIDRAERRVQATMREDAAIIAAYRLRSFA